MITDENIIELFFARSEQGIRELDTKYGKDCHNLSYHIVGSRQDAEECVNDAYLGAWNAIPPARPNPLLTYICKIVRNISLKNLYIAQKMSTRYSCLTTAIILSLKKAAWKWLMVLNCTASTTYRPSVPSTLWISPYGTGALIDSGCFLISK